MNYPPTSVRRRLAGFTALALLGLPVAESQAANFTWGNFSGGNWSVPANWTPAGAPTGTDMTDVLEFGGSVVTPYTATNNVANPFLLNQLVFSATDTATGNTHFLAGSALRLTGSNPQIVANGAGGVRIDTPIQLTAPLVLSGNGTGVITMNNTVSGTWDIVKNGTSTFRFGSQTLVGPPAVELPSDNTWFGKLTINAGTIRFNNNDTTGRTALRSNPVQLSAATTLAVSSELRVGTLSGLAGTVESRVTGANTPNEDIIINAIGSDTYGGILRLVAGTGTGSSDGELIVRGTGTQTLTGTVEIAKDVIVGRGAGLVLGGAASLKNLEVTGQGTIIFNGGSFKLDNRTVNNQDRLRNGTNTGFDSIGGGELVLMGNAAGTTESASRIQLGSGSNNRAGNMTVRVVHDSGTTIFNFASYSRDSSTINHYTTIDFGAATTAGVAKPLGTVGGVSRIAFPGFTVPLSAQLISNSAGTETGWATVNGTDFATYNSTLSNGTELGVQAVATSAFPGGTGSLSTNAVLNASGLISSASTFSLNSLKILPSGPNLTLSISAAGVFNNRNFLLAGSNDFTLQNTNGSTAGITGGGTRYFHVEQAMLNVDVALGGGTGANSSIVKAGQGFLSLLKDNSAIVQPVVVNSGVVRSSLANLPKGELRLRGGVYEIEGGGTFRGQITFGAGTKALPVVNWAGIDSVTFTAIDQDRGSGGFSAFNGNITLDLNTAGPSDIAWEDKGFLNSGHSLIFNSVRADSLITWSDNLRLTAVGQAVNYNAREIRVLDNPAFTTDFARISGVISGIVQDDLLKSGPGTLELTATNTYLGATQVAEGTLRINGMNAATFLTDVRSGAILAGNGTTGPVRLEIGGIVAPGNLEGNASILNTVGELRASAGSQFAIQLGGKTPGGNGTTGYDQLNVSGEVILNGADLAGMLIGTFVPQMNDLFFIIANDGMDPVQGQFAQGTAVSIGGFPFQIGYTGNWTGVPGTSTFTNGNDVVLKAVPEPTTALLAAAGLCTLALRRRRGTRS